MKKILLILPVILVIFAILYFYTSKVNYTKEFAYLPSYKNMKPTHIEQPANAESFGNAVFVTKEVNTLTDVEKYKAIFRKDGWTLSEEKENYFRAQKESHNTTVFVNGRDIMIWTK